MTNDELKNKWAEIPSEEPDSIDLQMLKQAKLENADSDGIDMEEYFARRKSSAISLRIPRSLRDQLQNNANAEGVSLNQYCMYLLTSGVSANGR